MTSPRSPDIYICAYRFAAEAHWNAGLKQVVPGTDIPYLAARLEEKIERY